MAKRPGGMPIVSFTIEPGQKAFIKSLAVRLGVPESRIFREAIDRFMSDPNHNLRMQSVDNMPVLVDNPSIHVDEQAVAS